VAPPSGVVVVVGVVVVGVVVDVVGVVMDVVVAVLSPLSLPGCLFWTYLCSPDVFASFPATPFLVVVDDVVVVLLVVVGVVVGVVAGCFGR